ncbi:MAG: tonB [Rhodospirillales bacterium]|nr:tonB [Rhodospirillales bacterium]
MSHYDDELEFRPRRRLRGPVIVVALMVLFAGGLWWAYSSGKSHSTAEVPLLRADDSANKKRPDQPGGMRIPDQDKCIYDPIKCSDGGKGAQTEKLLPPPETPVTGPVPVTPPPEQTAVAPPPASPLPAIVQAPAAPPAQQPVTPPVVQAPPQPSPPSPVAVARPPAPEPKPAPIKQSPPASTGKAGAYRLQIGAVRSEAAAQQEWDRLKKSQKDLLGGIGAGWSRADLGERGIFYRILAGPIDDGVAAERICGELKKRSVGCILVRQ